MHYSFVPLFFPSFVPSFLFSIRLSFLSASFIRSFVHSFIQYFFVDGPSNGHLGDLPPLNPGGKLPHLNKKTSDLNKRLHVKEGSTEEDLISRGVEAALVANGT